MLKANNLNSNNRKPFKYKKLSEFIIYMATGLRSVQNEVLHLMENDNFENNRRQPVLSVVDRFTKSKEYIQIVSVAIKNQKKENVIKVSTVPLLINIIVSCVSIVDLGKQLQRNDMKYFIYGVLYSFILAEDADFFSDISLETFETLYDNIYDVLMLAPDLIDIGSTACKVIC